MNMQLKHTMLTGASVLLLSVAGAMFTSSSVQAGPLAVTPKADIAVNPFIEKTQYRRGGRVAARGYVRRGGYVRAGGVRYARGGYYGGRRYAYRGGYYNPFFPVAALGLFAGAVGAASYSSSYYCDPAYYSWNYGDGCYSNYYSGYYPAYSGGYYPAYWGGYYPGWRARRVVYRSGYYRPRTVGYRAVAPRRHFVGSRTYVRSGYAVRRARY